MKYFILFIYFSFFLSVAYCAHEEGIWYERVTLGNNPTDFGGHSVASDSRNDWIFGGFQEALSPGQSNVYFNSMYRFNRRSGFWSKVDPLWSIDPNDRPEPRAFHNSFKHKRFVYVFGGVRYAPNYSANLPQIEAMYNDMWKYDPLFRRWHRLPTPSNASPKPRALAAGEYINGKFYLFGGVDENYNALGDTWEYDPDTNQWTELNPSKSPSPRQSIASATNGHEMTIFGGSSLDISSGNYNVFQDMWEFDPELNEWDLIPIENAFCKNISSSQMVAYKQRIYLHGGFVPDNDITRTDPLAHTNKFDLNTNQWTAQKEGPHLVRHTLSLVGREMCAIGGYDYDQNNEQRLWNNKVYCFIIPECNC